MNVLGAAPASRGAVGVRRAAAGLIAIAACCLPAATAAARPQPASGTVDLGALGESGTSIAAQGVGPPQLSGFGERVFIGDVNGDGSGDIAIGAPTADPAGRANAGSVYVVFGSGGSFAGVDLANLGDRGYRIDGRKAGDRLGTSIVGLGSAIGVHVEPFDAAGVGRMSVVSVSNGPASPADFAVGAPHASDGGPSHAGVVYLVAGTKSPPSGIDLAQRITDGSVIRLTGAAAGDRFGQSLAALDATYGLVIGARAADPGGLVDAGSVYVVTTLPTAVGGSGRLSIAKTTGYRLDGHVAGGRAGDAVGTSPDLDGDGVAEVLVGAPRVGPDAVRTYAGEAYVAPAATSGVVALGAPGVGGLVVTGGPGMGLGTSIAGVGDVNGDGIPDIAIGAPTASPDGRAYAGSLFVVSGGALPALPVAATATPGSVIRIDGARGFDFFGTRVVGANIDGDGAADLLVSAPLADPLARTRAGAVYALLGTAMASGPVDLLLLGRAGVRMAGPSPEDRRGASLAVGGAGNAKVIVGGTTSTTLLDLPAVAPAPAPISQQDVHGCMSARDIELVIDDSSSMSKGDPQFLRRSAVDALLSAPRDAAINVGAIEIGTRSAQVFPPLAVPKTGFADGRELATLRLLLAERINNDAGSANYAAGLAAGVAARPQASALLLITDGLEPPPPEPLASPGRRVYILQLGSGARALSADRLRELATNTGGQYFKGLDAETLPVALSLIDTDLNCGQVLKTRASRSSAAKAPTFGLAPPATADAKANAIGASTLSPRAPTATFATGVPRTAKTATLTYSFKPGSPARAKRLGCVAASPVIVTGLRIFDDHRTIARASERDVRRALGGTATKFGKLRALGRCGRGFLVLKIIGLERLPGAQVQAAGNSPTRPITVPIKLKKPARRRGVRGGSSGS